MNHTRSYFLTPIAACLCAGFSSIAQAQILDELELRQEGADAVAVIEFMTPVQYTKSISARAADLVQAFYTVLPTREKLSLENGERRLPGGGGIPAITVRDESANNQGLIGVSRKLVIRFSVPTKFKVRAGRKDNSIEVVMTGLGGFVQATTVKTTKVLPVSPVAGTVVAASAPVTDATKANEAAAATLLAAAQSAFDAGQYDASTESLNKLLNLPPNNSSRKAQELAGLARLNADDKTRAASEFDVFLKLYPEGPDSDRIRQLAATLPALGSTAASQTKPKEEPAAVINGSISSFYYGGKSNTRTQEFIDSPLGGLPVLQSDNTLSNNDQKQIQTNADFNWRYRDTEKDMRFVVRDSYTSDLLNSSKSKERLTALYFDYKSLTLGSNIRVGRQSPTGGGVMYRFDGVQAGYIFMPKWKVNAVMGQPTDSLLNAKRSFYGVSVDAEALTKELSGSVYLIEQIIDSETDRRGLGTELRYFKGGLSASGQLDYDLAGKALNIAAFQSTWQMNEATVFNAMLDRRTTPMMSLGNALFFPDPNLSVQATRIQDLLGSTSVDSLRTRVKNLTAYQNQFRIGGTTTLSPTWQVGGDFSLSSVGAIAPVPVLLPDGQPSTGTIWGVSAQVIGTNLYSARDTHVFNVSPLGGPDYHGIMLSYNNLSSINEFWQLEPSLRYYTQTGTTTGKMKTFTTGIRGIYRVQKQVSLESELTYERFDVRAAATPNGPGPVNSGNRVNYYLGARYEF